MFIVGEVPGDDDGGYIPIAKATPQGYTNALEKLYTRQAVQDVPAQRRTVFSPMNMPESKSLFTRDKKCQKKYLCASAKKVLLKSFTLFGISSV